MPCIQSLKHIHCLSSPHLAHNDPVRAHSQRRPDQITDSYGCCPCHIGHFGFQPYQIVNSPDTKLCVIFYSNDSFISGDIFRQSCQESSFTASCTSADNHGISCLHQLLQKSGTFRSNTAQTGQLLHGNRMLRKTPDRQDWSV